MKEMIKYGFILALICLVSSGILAVVNSVAEPKIKEQKEKEEKAALEEVMPQAEVFKPIISDATPVYYLAYDKAGKLTGFVIKSEAKGYSSSIQVMSGIDLKLAITNVKILSQNETPGLGNRITQPSFLNQFKAKGSDALGQVEAITGATISSTAVIDSIKNKISELTDQLKKEIKNAK